MLSTRALNIFIFVQWLGILLYILLPIIIIIFWINEPQYYIHQLHVQEDSINSSNPSINTSIFMDLEFKRRKAITTLRYNDVNITLSHASIYEAPRGFLQIFYDVVGYSVVPGFKAGKKKTVHREEVAVVPCGPLWRKIVDGSTVYVKVEVIPNHMKTAAAADAVFGIDRFGKVFKKPIALRCGLSVRVGYVLLALCLVILFEFLSMYCVILNF